MTPPRAQKYTAHMSFNAYACIYDKRVCFVASDRFIAGPAIILKYIHNLSRNYNMEVGYNHVEREPFEISRFKLKNVKHT